MWLRKNQFRALAAAVSLLLISQSRAFVLQKSPLPPAQTGVPTILDNINYSGENQGSFFNEYYGSNTPIQSLYPNVLTNNIRQSTNAAIVSSHHKRQLSALNMVIGSKEAAAFSVSSLPLPKNLKATFYMFLLAIQFGCQPILTKKFTPQNINRSTVVIVQDLMKFVMAGLVLSFNGNWANAVAGWNVSSWLMVAGIPASLYAVQNIASLMAYQKLEPLTFNVLNQTKTLSAALCCYLIMGRVQSRVQIAALILLFGASLVIEKVVSLDSFFSLGRTKSIEEKGDENNESVGKVDETTTSKLENHTQGVLAVLLASFISGLAGALSQKNLQFGGRDSYLFTMELCVASMIFLGISMVQSKDGKRVRNNGFFDEWTPQTLIPIATNAAGGIVVGLVTKYAGAVKKGFALIFGLLFSGILQASVAYSDEDAESSSQGVNPPRVSKEQIVGGIMAAISLWMHSSFPYKPK